MKPLSLKFWCPTLTALSLACGAASVQAQERESLEALRQTTLKLIDALVQTGAISRDKADALLQQAKAGGTAPVAATPAPGEAAGAATAEAPAKPVQRVPYISPAVRAQIRNELREEITAVARNERWGAANAAPSWTDRLKIDGDLRYRFQADRPGKDNTPATDYRASVEADDAITRAPDFSSVISESNPQTTASTTASRSRQRLRMRLGVSAKVSDEVSVGLRLATGSSTDRVSTNQTLGQNFNKYQLFIDRAYLRIDPTPWLTVQAGRVPNPWFNTEMVWSDNLSFEGISATARWERPETTWAPFVTVGAFPIREDGPPSRGDRWLYGAQLGANWDLSERTKLRWAVAYYQYQGIEGQRDLDFEAPNGVIVPGVSYGQHEYPAGLRQKGNTVFETNPLGQAASVWGLAYGFKPVTFTVSAELAHFSPYVLTLTAEYVKNTAFDLADFQRRAALPSLEDPGGQDDGYQLKMALGARDVQEAGQWQLAASYRHVGSDAVLDAFTDSDLGLGGTNLEGFTLGLTYGLYRNTNLGLRYLSAKTIDSPVSHRQPGLYQVNAMQVDLNVRF